MTFETAEEIPTDKGWEHELKFDGYRMMADVTQDAVRLVSRWGKDWTDRFPRIAAQLRKIVTVSSCFIDGELVTLNAQGLPDRGLLQQRGANAVFFAFDLLEVDGEPIISWPLSERREKLRNILRFPRSVKAKRSGSVQFSESFTDGWALLKAAYKMNLEGIVSKHKDSKYRPGKRTKRWLKFKIPYDTQVVRSR